MGILLRTEAMKVQWSIVILLIFLDTTVNAAMGIMQLDSLKEFFMPNWSTLYMYSVNFHAMFFYPLYCGILASLLCLYEHRDGGWRTVLSSPVPRYKFYYAKYLLLILILALVQIIFLLGYLCTGYLLHLPGVIPWDVLAYTIVGGWFGIFPLAALQLILSIKIRNFGAAFAMSICYVVPNIVLTGFHSSIGAWFPFTIPYYIMMPQTASYAPRVEFYSLWFIVLLTGMVYLFSGRRFFVRRDWL
ncbi:ABC transporter permease [Paenibacillus fonticola]|uniref:ABC transporter permease n=1 Tax=Paenibacillus fonticola TaxID=379896 RepID=UPI00036C4018|nr:ABC transporter permease [Paenibacillus fonticola]